MEDQRAGGPVSVRPPVDDPDRGTVVVGLQGQGQCQPLPFPGARPAAPMAGAKVSHKPMVTTIEVR